MRRDTRILVAGGTTLLGRALIEHLRVEGFTRLVGVEEEPDATDRAAVDALFNEARPEVVLHCAGLSGGIGLNRSRPADLMLHNLLVTANVLDAAQRYDVARLLYLASSCAYPRNAPQPLAVEALGTGLMEATSEAYATAKFAGWKLAEAYRRQYGCRFITGFPANSFGPHDDFSADSGHVVPSLLRRAHEAAQCGDRELVVWGTGAPRREFVHARDLARACLFVVEQYEGTAPINLGGGTDLSIAEVARAVADVAGFRGRIRFDASKPDGVPFKRLDSTPLLKLGWRPTVSFRDGLEETYAWYVQVKAADRSEVSPQIDERVDLQMIDERVDLQIEERTRSADYADYTDFEKKTNGSIS